MISLLLVLAVLQTNSAEPAPRPGPLALRNVSVFDATSGLPQVGQTLVLRGGRIVDRFPAGSKPLPMDVEVVDLSGQFAIPGLIDAHVHVTSMGPRENALRRLKLALLGGVTSVRDMGGNAERLASLAKAIEAGEVDAPRIYFTAMMAGPHFLANDERAKQAAGRGRPGEQAWLCLVTDETDIERAVADAKSTGATGIKIYAELSAELIEEVALEAKRQGLRVWSHAAVFPTRPSAVVEAGVEVVSHSADLIWETADRLPETYAAARDVQLEMFTEGWVDSPATGRLLERMVARGTVLDPTLFVFTRIGKSPGEEPPLLAAGIAFARRAHEAGVTIVAGTDMLVSPSSDSPNLQTELEMLVDSCGLSPHEALVAATITGARVVGREEDLGTLEVGKLADIVILAEDPSADVRNLRSVRRVYLGGRRIGSE